MRFQKVKKMFVKIGDLRDIQIIILGDLRDTTKKTIFYNSLI